MLGHDLGRDRRAATRCSSTTSSACSRSTASRTSASSSSARAWPCCSARRARARDRWRRWRWRRRSCTRSTTRPSRASSSSARAACSARTRVRNMEELGGLARRMPWTAWLFLLGAVAISALPPLNGFVSEWMTFQALLLGGASAWAARRACWLGVAASMLALTGGLAAACFAKAFGVTFLGRPRTRPRRARHRVAGVDDRRHAVARRGCAWRSAWRRATPCACSTRPPPSSSAAPGASAVVTARGPLVLSAGGDAAGPEATAISVTAVAALLRRARRAGVGLARLAARRRRAGSRRRGPAA